MSDRSVRSISAVWVSTLAFLLLLCVASTASAQSDGRIVGRIVDQATSEPLQSATVTIAGTRIGTITNGDGRYVLGNVPRGAVTVVAQTIGYASETASVTITDATVLERNFALSLQAVEMEAIHASAGARRTSVARGIEEQRDATAIVSSITAEQMSRSPDGDAAAAMQRVSGVTVQDGKYVSARGLGERYTTTSLNGARIPSPEPERKVIPLDLFPSGLLESITTSKTFTPDHSGDFSGAQVNIRTKEFAAERQLTFSSSFGLNDRVTGFTNNAAPRTGAEWLGFGGGSRALPGPLADAGDLTQTLSPSDYNALVGSFRNAWSVSNRTGRGNYSLGASIGGRDPVLGHNISYLASLTYGYSEDVRYAESRARAMPGDAGATVEVDRFVGSTGRASVLWGGMANLSTLLGNGTRAYLNTSYNRSADNEARYESGTSENYGNVPLQINRLKYVERDVFSAQLGAAHALAEAHMLSWAVTGSGVNRNEPDRSEIVYAQMTDPATGALLQPTWLSVSSEGAVRTFGSLDETALEASGAYVFSFGSGLSSHVKVGGLYRGTSRNAMNRSFSIASISLPETARQLTPEEIFDGRFTAPGQDYFYVVPLGAGGTYEASENLAAGFGMVDFGLGSRVRLIAGARIEHSAVSVTSQGTISTDTVMTRPVYTDVLPSLAVNVKLTDNQHLRLSASQTLSRPEYRELADVQYRDVLGGETVIGNPDLKRTLIQNADVRWEWYPAAGEVLSVGVFAKRFDNPIERVYRATSGTSVATFVNATSARNVGVELEARKQLGFIAGALESVTAFSNLTLMNSEIEIEETQSSATNTARTMVGQAPYVLNAGLTYSPADSDISATALFNIVGRRITSAGEIPLPDVYEEAAGALDLSIRAPLRGGTSVKLDAKNLLDREYRLTQGSVTRESYRTGRTFSFGMSWTR